MTDRDQVAREVLTELANWNMARVETLKDALRFRDEHYPAPAPAAPVTVTVTDSDGRPITLTRNAKGGWNNRLGNEAFVPRSLNADMASRIAADAQRIAELEHERDNFEQMAREYSDNADYYRRLVVQVGETCGRDAYVSDDGSVQQDVLCAKVPELVASMKRERDEAQADAEASRHNAQSNREYASEVAAQRDEARRALNDVRLELVDEMHTVERRVMHALRVVQAATSQGEGLGKITEAEQVAAEEPGDSRVTVEAAPAPIPLGAVVRIPDPSGCMDQWHWTGTMWASLRWEHENGRYASATGFHGDALTAYYRALHPVADRATVERVAVAISGVTPEKWATWGLPYRSLKLERARAALRALGVEVAE